MMFIYIITDEWNDGSQRQHIIGSNFQFSKEEFNKIVEETEKEMEESDTIYNSFFGKGIEIIDEGPSGGAFSSEADYWRYRMDPNY